MPDTRPKLEPSSFHSFMAAFSYGTVSVLMTFCNKAVLTTYKFEFENLILLLQMTAAAFFLWAMNGFGWIKLQPVSVERALHIFPVALLYVGSVGFGLASLSYLSVPIYNTLKRLTTFVVLLSEQYFMGKFASGKVQFAVVLTIIGAFMTGRGDLEYDATGYLFAALAILFQSGYLILVAKVGSTGLQTFDLLYYTSLISIPFLLVITLLVGEHKLLADYQGWSDLGFQFCLVFTITQGALLNFTLFYCTTINSALTTTIVGQLKVIVSTTIGLFTFGGADLDTQAYIGLLINTFGGVYYSYVKYQEKYQKQAVGKIQGHHAA